MAFLNSLEQLRNIEWGKKYLWDVKFEGAPNPFDVFFPAADVEETRARLEVFQFERYLDSLRIPLRRNNGLRNLRLTFFDNQDNTLVNWLDDWINRLVFSNGQIVRPVASITKTVTLLKLNAQKEQIEATTYRVFPEGEIVFNGSSSSDPQSYAVNFIIVGSGTKPEFPENNPA